MTDLAYTDQKKKNQPGLALRLIGALVAVLGLVNVVLQTSNPNADVGVAPWFGIIAGIGLVIVGYLQKMSAKK